LGGPLERRLDGLAGDWSLPRAADLNLVAVECRAGAGAGAAFHRHQVEIGGAWQPPFAGESVETALERPA
ncbi:hypothetical protein ACV34S_35340, partial [Pseudomonas aeruginosa]